ncbi:phospholipase A and acyltransferase 2-like isoform 1-T1 [Syngnathus typhle]
MQSNLLEHNASKSFRYACIKVFKPQLHTHTSQPRAKHSEDSIMDLEAQIEEISSKAKFGDLIEFSFPIGYSHWAVYDDDGHVIHLPVTDELMLMRTAQAVHKVLASRGKLMQDATRICRVPISEVTLPRGTQIRINNNRHAFTPSSPEEIRRRRDALEDVELVYNYLVLNCEHFATFVRYGKAICNQILTKPQNRETKSATKVFRNIVDSKDPS